MSDSKDTTPDPRDLVLTLCPVKPIGDKPLPMAGHTMSLFGNTLFLLGGANNATILNGAYTCDIGSLRFEVVSMTGTRPGPLFGHTATLIQHRLFVFGGLTYGSLADEKAATRKPLASTSPSAATVAKAGSASSSLRHSLFGKRPGEEPSAGLYTMRIDTKHWETPACSGTAPPPLYLHAACAVGSQLVVFGGCTKANYAGSSADLFVLDTEKNIWSKPRTSGVAPSARHGHSLTSLGDGRVLLFGGACEDSEKDKDEQKIRRFNDVFILDLKTMAWSQPSIGGSAPLPRAFHSAGIVGSQPRLLYIFAGETNQVSSDLCVLNLEHMKWARPLFDGSFEHMLHAAVVVSDKMLIFGGMSPTGGVVDDFFFINTVTIRSGVTENDHTFKLVLIGDSSVGKSCLMTRFVDDRFSDIHLSTIGVDFKTMTTMLDGKIVKLHIWDTAGQERFAQVTTHYYRGADGAILVYDTTNAQSFESIENWAEAVQSANSNPVVLLLVGNKNDLVDERQVTRQSGEELAAQLNAPFMETSARKQTLQEKKPEKRIKLDAAGSPPPETGCCKG